MSLISANKTVVIFQAGDLSRYRCNKTYLDTLCGTNQYELLYVVNRKVGDTINNERVLISDNRYREFSAWELGLKNLNWDPEVRYTLIFMNETHDLYREKFVRLKLRQRALAMSLASSRNLLSGELHVIRKPGGLPEEVPREYMNTAFFMVTSTGRPQFSFTSGVEELNGSYRFELSGDEIFQDYISYLRDIVIGKGKIKWHGSIGLRTLTDSEVNKKVMSVVLEHSLTRKLENAGYEKVDYLKIIPLIYWPLKLLDRAYQKFHNIRKFFKGM